VDWRLVATAGDDIRESVYRLVYRLAGFRRVQFIYKDMAAVAIKNSIGDAHIGVAEQNSTLHPYV
jgi:hypothetical protein